MFLGSIFAFDTFIRISNMLAITVFMRYASIKSPATHRITMLKDMIENAFEQRANLTPETASLELKQAVNQAIALLNLGQARVAEKIDGVWQTHQWLKKAVLLY